MKLGLSQCAAEALAEYMRRHLGAPTRPGTVVSITTAGDLIQWHPHVAQKLLKWRHPGFSAHIGEPIAFEDKKVIEDVASYLVKAPLSLKKLVYLFC